ncbi:murein L,D-transpeptidase family protein [Bacteroidota bacterium]
MKYKVLVVIFLFAAVSVESQQSFREKQQSYSRVKDAYENQLEGIDNMLEAHDIDREDMDLFIVGFKQEKDLEVWAKNKSAEAFTKITSYDFCVLSGDLGPKRQQGDLQVPEGFYYINVYNPWSNFHLSMGLNYPNRSDRILGVQGQLGGDIYIHGSCVSIGCIPITTRNIKQMYVMCVEARNGGQERIPVHLFPARLNRGVRELLVEKNDPDAETENLWQDLQEAYDYFTEEKKIPRILFLNNGRHQIN